MSSGKKAIDCRTWVQKIRDEGNDPEDWLDYLRYATHASDYTNEELRTRFLVKAHQEAVTRVRKTDRSKEAFGMLMVSYAQLFEKKNDTSTAENLYQQALAVCSGSSFVNVAAAQFYFERGRPDKSRKILVIASEKKNSVPREMLTTALSRLDQGKASLADDIWSYCYHRPVAAKRNNNKENMNVPHDKQGKSDPSPETQPKRKVQDGERAENPGALSRPTGLSASVDVHSYRPEGRDKSTDYNLSLGFSSVRKPHGDGKPSRHDGTERSEDYNISLGLLSVKKPPRDQLNLRVLKSQVNWEEESEDSDDDNEQKSSAGDGTHVHPDKYQPRQLQLPATASSVKVPAASAVASTSPPMAKTLSPTPFPLSADTGPHPTEIPPPAPAGLVRSTQSAVPLIDPLVVPPPPPATPLTSDLRPPTDFASRPPPPVSIQMPPAHLPPPLFSSGSGLSSVESGARPPDRQCVDVPMKELPSIPESAKSGIKVLSAYPQQVDSRVKELMPPPSASSCGHPRKRSGEGSECGDRKANATNQAAPSKSAVLKAGSSQPGGSHERAGVQPSFTRASSNKNKGNTVSSKTSEETASKVGKSAQSPDIASSSGQLSMPAQLPTIIIQQKPYAVLSQIGKGGSSKVEKVMDLTTFQQYALKTVNLAGQPKESVVCFKKEIDLLDKLKHCDRVIRMYSYEYSDTNILILLELGQVDLESMLKQNHGKVFKHVEIAFYWAEMLDAVSRLHEVGIIHRDLKPANFMVVSGRVKLIDFGIAKTIQQDVTSLVLDSCFGTINFMAPEVLNDVSASAGTAGGKRQFKVGKQSDVWSLGCILYCMAYGHTPFEKISPLYAKAAAISNPNHAIAFPDIGNPKLVDTLQRCLLRDPKMRPSIDELLRDSFVA